MQNVKSLFLRYWQLILFFLAVILVWFVSSRIILGCEDNTEKVGTTIATNAVEQITLNNQIAGLQRQIELLESKISRLDSQIAVVDSLRVQNFADSRNKSNVQHYSDLSKRYAHKKPN